MLYIMQNVVNAQQQLATTYGLTHLHLTNANAKQTILALVIEHKHITIAHVFALKHYLSAYYAYYTMQQQQQQTYTWCFLNWTKFTTRQRLQRTT